MDKLNFYDVDPEYIIFLQREETKARGFTKVTNIEYPERNERHKFLCGIVLKINDINYYVPVSSNKKKQKDNLLIIFKKDNFNQVKGSLKFIYMIPIPDECLRLRVIDAEPDRKRALFLNGQLDYINSVRENIYKLAERVYTQVINKYSPALVDNSCDFRLLEQKCLKYCEMKGYATTRGKETEYARVKAERGTKLGIER